MVASNDKESRLFAAVRDPNEMRRLVDIYAAAQQLTAEEIPDLLTKIRASHRTPARC
jgi:hypothetical protein